MAQYDYNEIKGWGIDNSYFGKKKETEENWFPIMKAISDERRRQDEKWGEQNHDDLTWLAILTEEVGEVAQAILHDIFGGKAAGTVETELIQCATVIIQWVQCRHRNKRK